MSPDADAGGAIVARTPVDASSAVRRAGRAIAVAAWLALTVLFTFGGVALTGTLVTAVWRSPGTIPGVVTLLGSLAGVAVAPTLARSVVLSAAKRVETIRNRSAAVEPGRRWIGSYGEDRDRRRTPCPCYS